MIDQDEPFHTSVMPLALVPMPLPAGVSMPTARQNVSLAQDTLFSCRAPPGSARGAVCQVPELQMSELLSYWFESKATQYVVSGHEMVLSPVPSVKAEPLSTVHVPAPVARPRLIRRDLLKVVDYDVLVRQQTEE